MCLVFRRDQCEELYFEHVRGIIECMESLTVFKSLVRKLSLIFSDREEMLASLMRLSAIVHDVGKLSEDRQKECLYGDYVEFKYHYVISARLGSCLVTGSYEDVEAILYEKGTGRKARSYIM